MVNVHMEFACTKFAPERIIRCAFGLTKLEFELFLFLCAHSKEFTSKSLKEEFDINLATVQRSLKKFSDLDLVQRRQVNYELGGYEFMYIIKSRIHIRLQLKKKFHLWMSAMEKEISSWSKTNL